MAKYDSMSVSQLRAEHKARGLSGYSQLRKADLIAGLEAHDKIQAAVPEEKTINGVNWQAPVLPLPKERVNLTQAEKTRKARNRAKARRRKLRASGFQA